MLLHGWLGTNADLYPLSTHLNSQGYPTVIPDLPFHGESRDVRPKSLAHAAKILAKALAELLHATSTQPVSVVLLGYSLGGRIAFELARLLSINDAALNVNAVILLSSAPPPQTGPEIIERAANGVHLARRINEVDPTKEAFSQWLHQWYDSDMWGGLRQAERYEEMVERKLQRFDENTTKAYAQAAETMSVYENGLQDCLKVPSLYLYGERDAKYKGYARIFMDLFERCKVVGVENAGHNILVQETGIVQQIVRAFLMECCMGEGEAQRVQDVKVLRYLLPLTKEIIVKGVEVSKRAGVLVAVKSAGGFVGVGDICPLPGVHEQDLRNCLAEVERFSVRLNESGNVFSWRRFSLRDLEQLVEGISNVSRNGITCALINLLVHAWDVDVNSVIKVLISNCTTSPFDSIKGYLSRLNTVRLNGVLPRLYPTSERDDQMGKDRRMAIINFLQNSCFETLKVKVGTISCPADEGQYIREAVQEAKHQGLKLRLDANRAWTRQQFDLFQRSLAQDSASIEFIEEPLQSMADLAAHLNEAQSRGTLNIGLDESLNVSSLDTIRKLASSSSCKALVVKPAVIGSLTRMLEIFEIAIQSHCEVIMSTVFDSGVGIAWTSLLASVFGGPQACHGLGTFQYLLKDVIEGSFEQICLLDGFYVSSERCRSFLVDVAKHVMDVGVSVSPANNFCI